MDISEPFGRAAEALIRSNPAYGRWLLKVGWEAMNLKFQIAPDKQLAPPDQYLAHMMMDAMLLPLQHPDQCAIVSIFTPCELLHVAQLNPYNAEAFSSYLSASNVEQECIRTAEDEGIAETLCSYHKIFLGAAQRDLMPKPRCIVYTNLTCDANLLTFKTLAQLYDVPAFCIDVPAAQTQRNVDYVADQLRDLRDFLQRISGRTITDDDLSEHVARSKRTLELYGEYMRLHAGKFIPADLVTPLYCAMANNILLGRTDEEHYVSQLVEYARQAPPACGRHIYWMHAIPYWSEAVKSELFLKHHAQIVGCEIGQACPNDFDPNDPFSAMAYRMVYNHFNGSALRRIDAGIQQARTVEADGVIWFNHWGCKHTIGASHLAKRKFEEAGFPFLLLDGDACDKSNGGEGQTATRLGAFLELLDARSSSSRPNGRTTGSEPDAPIAR